MSNIKWNTIKSDDDLVTHVAVYDGRSYAEISHHVDFNVTATGNLWVHILFPVVYENKQRPVTGYSFDGSLAKAKRKVAADIREYIEEICGKESSSNTLLSKSAALQE